MRPLVMAVLALAASASFAWADDRVPVMYGGIADLDACGSQGEVTGLDPQGDNFLAVRAGPGTGYKIIDKLPPAARLDLCDEKGKWIGVVYGPDGVDCGTGTPVAKRQPYDGPCKSGWVFRKYVNHTAG